MKIELKNIKHSEFASQETHCYQASLYVDNKRIGIVSNDGHGGSDMFMPTKPEDRDVYAKACEYLAEQATEEWIKEARSSVAMEIFCGDAVNDWLYERDLKKTLKRRICYVHAGKESDGIYQLKAKFKPTQENFDSIKRSRPEWVLLNTMPLSEALRIWKEQA